MERQSLTVVSQKQRTALQSGTDRRSWEGCCDGKAVELSTDSWPGQIGAHRAGDCAGNCVRSTQADWGWGQTGGHMLGKTHGRGTIIVEANLSL